MLPRVTIQTALVMSLCYIVTSSTIGVPGFMRELSSHR